MTPRNKSTLPARQRKAGAHQDGARRPESDSGCYGTGVHCDGCHACGAVAAKRDVLDGVAVLMAPVSCPYCAQLVTNTASGCGTCEMFRCPRCTTWVTWNEGCGDTMLCDPCWFERGDGAEDRDV
jgi:hypothetical protein